MDSKHGENLFSALMQAAGDGVHSITIVSAIDRVPTAARLTVTNHRGHTHVSPEARQVATELLTQAVTTPLGGLIGQLTGTGPATVSLRIWRIRDGAVRPLPAREAAASHSSLLIDGVAFTDAPDLSL